MPEVGQYLREITFLEVHGLPARAAKVERLSYLQQQMRGGILADNEAEKTALNNGEECRIGGIHEENNEDISVVDKKSEVPMTSQPKALLSSFVGLAPLFTEEEWRASLDGLKDCGGACAGGGEGPPELFAGDHSILL